MKVFWSILILSFCSVLNVSAKSFDSLTQIPLNDGWQFREVNKMKWNKAMFPVLYIRICSKTT